MPRLPRLFPLLMTGCVVSVLASPLALAQDAATTAPGDAAAPAVATPAAAAPAMPEAPSIPPELLKAAEDFWHYASIARYDVATANAQKLAAGDARNVLESLEAVVEYRNRYLPPDQQVQLYDRLMTWQRLPEMKDSATALLNKLAEARRARATDFNFIDQSINSLGGNQRAYTRAVQQLRESGEIAVTRLVAALKDKNKANLRPAIRSALRDMGDEAVKPLLAATEMKDTEVLPWVIAALGDLGRKASVPYLARLATAKDQPEGIRTAAAGALLRMRINIDQLDPAQLFYEQAEELYYGKSSLAPRDPSRPAFVWFWDGARLNKADVPASVLMDHLAMRSCEYVLSLQPSRGDAVSLWLAAAYKREVDMPEGGVDQWWDEKHPAAHYYAVAAGTQYLNNTLARALSDHNAAVALKAIRSLNEIVGASNLYNGGESKPVLSAMRYGDRRVRFEAAMTVAQSLPQQAFTGQELVIPILCEAIAQTGKPGVLVVGGTQDDVNKRAESLTKTGTYLAKGGPTVEAAILASTTMPGVDVIIVSERDRQQVESLFAQIRGNVRLERAAILILVASKQESAYASLAKTDPQITLALPGDDAALIAAIEEARKRAGVLPMDEKMAVGYAVRSCELLSRLAISRGQVLDLSGAEGTLLAALDDARPEIVKAAGQVLGYLNQKENQSALLTKAMMDKTADDVKISMFKSLSSNAKLFGNQLGASEIGALTKFVETAANLDVRSAAAEAHGALNLRPDQVKTLILNQSRR